MGDLNLKSATSDWTDLLADPELFGHLGELLRTYRETPAEGREQALLAVMRKIKGAPPNDATAATTVQAKSSIADENSSSIVSPPSPNPGRRAGEIKSASAAIPNAPPFEPSLFAPTTGEDRRIHPRLKCFVAVELRIEGYDIPVWGNLSNTSLGGCFVETVTPVPTGVKSEIGLWVANGKIWVKGLILNGIVTRSTPAFGVRFKFVDQDASERETRREFFRFIENTNKGYQNQHGYLAQIKR